MLTSLFSFQEDARIEKQSRRALELDTLRNNANLLEEMLKHVGPGDPPSSDKDVMEVRLPHITSLFHPSHH